MSECQRVGLFLQSTISICNLQSRMIAMWLEELTILTSVEGGRVWDDCLVVDDDGVQLHPCRKCGSTIAVFSFTLIISSVGSTIAVSTSFCNLQTLSTICKGSSLEEVCSKVRSERMSYEVWSGDGVAPCAMTTQRNAGRLCQKMF
jgi:hypothetical protein